MIKNPPQPPTPDYSEWLSGPALIALEGSVAPESEYLLGTREVAWHQHPRGQVFCVESGLLHVHTADGAWFLPPHRASWLPPGVTHKVSISGAVKGWTLLIAPESCSGLPEKPCVIAVSEVLHALARRACEWDKQAEPEPEQKRMAAVIYDEICRAPHEALHLPMPTDNRLKKVAYALLANPGDERTFEAWAAFGALSPRTLRRLFVAETGLNFAQWRRQVRLTHGLDKLAQGMPVSEVSELLGYASPGNFIHMFKNAFGTSPARYFSAGK